MRLLGGAVAVAACLATSGCDGCGESDGVPGLPTATATVPATEAGASGEAGAKEAGGAPMNPPQPKMACVYIGPEPPHEHGVSLGVDWLDLAAGLVSTAKDPTTGREATFVGPGKARACVDFELESWVAPPPKGDVVFTSVIGGGEAPGNEGWIMTPLGVVRYASARMEIRTSGERVQVNVGVGTAYVWTEAKERERKDAGAYDPRANDAGVEGGWVRVDRGATVTLTPSSTATPEAQAQAAVDRCAALASEAHAIAAEFGAPDAALGELAVRHVVARRVARAACGVARVRAESLAPSDKATAIATAALAADATWRSLSR